MPNTVAVHQISFRGTAGAIFVLLCVSVVLYVIGFATTGWSIHGRHHEGLWLQCNCGLRNDDAWFMATQAMLSIGLIGLCLAFILIVIYMGVHSISKNLVITALAVMCFIAVIFMVIGFAVYGSKRDGLNWSFAFAVMGGITTLAAGILSVYQLRSSGV